MVGPTNSGHEEERRPLKVHERERERWCSLRLTCSLTVNRKVFFTAWKIMIIFLLSNWWLFSNFFSRPFPFPSMVSPATLHCSLFLSPIITIRSCTLTPKALSLMHSAVKRHMISLSVVRLIQYQKKKKKYDFSTYWQEWVMSSGKADSAPSTEDIGNFNGLSFHLLLSSCPFFEFRSISSVALYIYTSANEGMTFFHGTSRGPHSWLLPHLQSILMYCLSSSSERGRRFFLISRGGATSLSALTSTTASPTLGKVGSTTWRGPSIDSVHSSSDLSVSVLCSLLGTRYELTLVTSAG